MYRREMLSKTIYSTVSKMSRQHRRSSSDSVSWAKAMNKTLQETDTELYNIMEGEKLRQRDSLVLIASENFTSKSVFDALGSIMSNKYSEGYPGARYYGGNEHIDKVETLCQVRAIDAFGLDPSLWGVNVQSLSGSPANMQAYGAVLNPHDRIMSLDLPHGGHLSHGYQTDTKKISAVSIVYETFPYRLNEETGIIDYDRLEENAKLYRPKLIVAGASAYARLIDYKRMRAICDLNSSWLLSDIAHISGLVSAGVIPSPFEYSDIVTTTTHKSLRGPRGAMIFYRKGLRSVNKKGEQIMYDLESKINFSVFPGHQGGPHNHTIAALATALQQASTSEYKAYQLQVLKNCKHLAQCLLNVGYNLVGGGTDNHLVLVNLKKSTNCIGKNIDGAKVERVLELANIATNKNTVPGDVSALSPGGIRMGTPALTTRNLLSAVADAVSYVATNITSATVHALSAIRLKSDRLVFIYYRGFTEDDFEKVAEFFDRAVKITIATVEKTGPKVKDFKAFFEGGPEVSPDLVKLKADVTKFAQGFPTIGF